MVEYTQDISALSAEQLDGFFVGWPAAPDPARRLEILRASYRVWLAMDGGRCVGFINALSDGIFYAFLPLLEVLPEYQGRGIGKELVRRMVESLGGLYGIDIVCDEEIAPFYAKLGFARCCGMVRRNI